MLSSSPETADLAEVLRSGYPWFGGIYLVFIAVLWVLWPNGADERNNRQCMYLSLEDFASTRRKAVADGLDSRELAALMVEKFAEGVQSCGRDVIQLADRLCTEIDPSYRENRQLRYRAIAKLDLSQMRS